MDEGKQTAMRQPVKPVSRPKDGAFASGRRAGLADRHRLGSRDYDGWRGPEWIEWFRGWVEGQREAREAAERGDRHPMRYEKRFALRRKPIGKQRRSKAQSRSAA